MYLQIKEIKGRGIIVDVYGRLYEHDVYSDCIRDGFSREDWRKSNGVLLLCELLHDMLSVHVLAVQVV